MTHNPTPQETDTEVLERVIQKAIDGRWDILSRAERDGFIVRADAYGYPFIAWTDDEDESGAFAQNYMEVIFDHDFAKALWPPDEKDGTEHHLLHLERLAKSTDRIDYLRRNA